MDPNLTVRKELAKSFYIAPDALPPPNPSTPYLGKSIVELLPADIFYIIFAIGGLRPLNRIAFGFTCHTARSLLIDCKRAGRRKQSTIEIRDDFTGEDSMFFTCIVLRIREAKFPLPDPEPFWCYPFGPERRFDFEFKHLIAALRSEGWSDVDVRCYTVAQYISNVLYDRQKCRSLGKEPRYANGATENENQLMILAITFLLYPWLFLGTRMIRMCIGCLEILPEHAQVDKVDCADVHSMPVDKLIMEFFACDNYPACYSSNSDTCKESFISRVKGGDASAVGLSICRIYWECQTKMKARLARKVPIYKEMMQKRMCGRRW